MTFLRTFQEHILQEQQQLTMPKQFNYGGQRRTSQTTCGFTCKGSVREVNFKIKLHQRICLICEPCPNDSLDEFNKVAGMTNGWNNFKGDSKVTKRAVEVSINGGEIKGLFSQEGHTFEDAFESIQKETKEGLKKKEMKQKKR